MKKIFKIHILSYLIALIAVLTGHFRLYLNFMLLIIIHELGHIIAGIIFKWRLKEIVILPLGMISKFHTLINVSMLEELIVASSGIILQITFYYFFLRNNEYYDICNLIIIIFNLLPILPLDGSKILNNILNRLFSFKLSYTITIYVSFVLCFIIIILGILNKDLILIIIFVPLLTGLIKEYKKIPSIINKFYLERYLYNFKYIKTIEIKDLSQMKREYNHTFKLNNKIYKEKELLKNLFDKH